ncbi:methyltransferase [Microvirga brassicacearum]|uniref:Methyltransferase n=1 Tax=Microvirga brassicacearum TaxID=2580413 RepID=A0A5N3P5A4_9HYPH|nr:methyltransferase [Microvirga brassicacearum]KAB0264920.1 methyltransferase [Microvirga brassicacearum]
MGPKGHDSTPSRIPNRVLNVLDQAEFAGNSIRLTGKLDRDLYVATNKVIEAAGGKWSSKLKVHEFSWNAADAIEQVILTGCVTKKQELGQFDSPAPIVDRAVDMAQIEDGMLVLEPSAGTGNIVKAAKLAGARVMAYELDPERFAALEAGIFNEGGIANDDFLTVSPNPIFDRVVMNPPFSRQADIDHVLHAANFLKPGGRLVAIMAEGVMFRGNKKAANFRNWVEAHSGTIESLPHGAFKESGTRFCRNSFFPLPGLWPALAGEEKADVQGQAIRPVGNPAVRALVSRLQSEPA